MKKWRNFLIYIMSFFIVCVAVPQIRAKYFYEINSQNSENKNDAFNIHFPIESLEEQATNLALDSFLNILNKDAQEVTVTINGTEYTDTPYNLLVGNGKDSLMGQGTSNMGDRNDSYVGNVVGDNSEDTLVLEQLFGKENMTMTDAEGKTVEVTVMIKIDEVDSDNPVTGMQYSYTAPAEGLAGLFGQKVEFNFDGAEMILFASAADFQNLTSDTVEVYASVFTKYNNSDWTLLNTFFGKAPTNNYESGDRGNPNSFNTDKWESSVAYVNSVGETIAIGTDLKTLTQNEATAVANRKMLVSS